MTKMYQNILKQVEEILIDNNLILEYDQRVILLDIIVNELELNTDNEEEVENYTTLMSTLNNRYSVVNITSSWEGKFEATLNSDLMKKRFTENPKSSHKFQSLRKEALTKYHPDIRQIYNQLKKEYGFIQD